MAQQSPERVNLMAASILLADSLGVSRGDRVLFSGLSLHLHAGDIVHLRGRNGVGKTSLLEVLAGLRQPAAGAVHRGENAALHWLGHRDALNPDLSPLENLEHWSAIHSVDRGGIVPALERMGVAHLRHRACRRLSAGQRRRTSLARLTLVERPLWLLDEPLSSLDAEGLRRFGELLTAHLERGGAAVVSSHQALPARLPRVTVMELA